MSTNMNLIYLLNANSRERAVRMFGTARHMDNGCIEWTRSKFHNGYGQFPIETCMGKMQHTHRISYLLHNGPFDPKLLVRHSCNNPACVNPDHLQLGTHQDNSDDKVRANRQYRPKGERHHKATVTEAQVWQIREMFPVVRKEMRAMAAYRAVAAQIGTEATIVRDVIKGRSWAWLSVTAP